MEVRSAQQACDGLHVLRHADVEGATGLTAAAEDAVGGVGIQSGVVLPHRSGNVGLGYGQVVELMNHGHVDTLGTGLAVAAVGTLAAAGVTRSMKKNIGIAAFVS